MTLTPVELRELVSVEELGLCEDVQRVVWGEPVPEVTVASFRAAVHAGALVAGALEGERLLGFAYGFPSFVGGRVGLHSHMLAVVPEARGRGLGRALKWFQRDWCRARGITSVTWTFDPLRAKNARLNLEHLGAFVGAYYTDFYGSLGDELSGELPTDRVVAEWPLTDARVVALAASKTSPPPQKPALTLLSCTAEGEPERQLLPDRLTSLWLELPPDIAPTTDFARALRWRLALRETLSPLLARGYRAARFVDGGYLLEPPASAA